MNTEDAIATVVDPKAHADPPRLYDAFAWLRHNQPLARAELPGFDPFYVVTRHADILEISRDNVAFPYGSYPSTLAPHQAVEQGRAARAAGRPLLYTLVQMDEPDHMKYRALTQGWFMPQNLRKLEDGIRVLARAAVDRMEELGGACDFVGEVALHFPLRVIMNILGRAARGRAAHAAPHPGAVRRHRSGPAAQGQRARDRGVAGHGHPGHARRFLQLFQRPDRVPPRQSARRRGQRRRQRPASTASRSRPSTRSPTT